MRSLCIVIFCSTALAVSCLIHRRGAAIDTGFPENVKIEASLELNRDGSGTLKIRNKTNQELEVKKLSNRLVLAFLVTDQRGNVIKPTFRAKVNPFRATFTLARGNMHIHSFKNLDFLTGTGLCGYDLKKGKRYRVVAVYRPAGANGPGFSSDECLLDYHSAEAANKIWRIRVSSHTTSVTFNEDGTRYSKPIPIVRGRRSQEERSPDGNKIVFVDRSGGDAEIAVADADGRNQRIITDNNVMDKFPSWSPDSKRIVFLSTRDGATQVFVMDQDGDNVQKLSHSKNGASCPQFSRDGRIAYVEQEKPGAGKLIPSRLVVLEGARKSMVARNVYIPEFAWSPDGKMIAYTTLGKLVFHEIASGNKKEIIFKDVDERLSSFCANSLAWRPDSRVMVCSIQFHGSRRGTREGHFSKMFGDDQVFIIPLDGKIAWFDRGNEFSSRPWTVRFDWVKGD